MGLRFSFLRPFEIFFRFVSNRISDTVSLSKKNDELFVSGDVVICLSIRVLPATFIGEHILLQWLFFFFTMHFTRTGWFCFPSLYKSFNIVYQELE